MTKRRAPVVTYEVHSYEVGYDFNGKSGYVFFPRSAPNFGLATVTAGFWLNNDMQPAALGEERYFVMPHMITYIRKDYRKVQS